MLVARHDDDDDDMIEYCKIFSSVLQNWVDMVTIIIV